MSEINAALTQNIAQIAIVELVSNIPAPAGNNYYRIEVSSFE